MSITEEFRRAMADAGLPFSGTIHPDSDKIQRFTVEGDRHNARTGWYVLYTDGVPAGEFGCWKRGFSSTWCGKSGSSITPEERAQIEQRRQQAQAAREQQRADEYAAAAELAGIIWDAAKPCSEHPYLTRKGVQCYGLRTMTWRREFAHGDDVVVENALIIPIRKNRKVVSLQAIFPERNEQLGRDKDFLPGGEKRGCYFTIGKPEGDAPTIVICEGYSTGASIHEATGYPVVVAFDAGNLKSCAEAVAKKFPSAHFIVAGDNDRWTLKPVENPGAHYAREAASAIFGQPRIAEFSDLDGKPTDFNDLHQREGLAEVARQINGESRTAVTTTEILPPDEVAKTVGATNLAVPSDVDWYSPFPMMSASRKPLQTIENIVEACNRLNVTVRYNIISKEVEILIPGERFTVDNAGNASLARITSQLERFRVPTGKIGEYLTYIADQNLYNPVAEWVRSKPWDGKSRLNDFYNTIRADGEEDDVSIWDLKAALMRRWMISAVAAAFEPNGVSAGGVLVLQGDQYLGKTKWFKSLVPAELGLIQDGLMLKPDDRDSVKVAVSYWLVELGELDATFRRSDIAQLKAFLTRQQDEIRRAYARVESKYARRTVFFASVNPRQFLHDPTGNRRYWTISCSHIEHSHDIDMQQVWAEIYEAHYSKGESWHLSPDEMRSLNGHNQDHEVLDPIRERLQSVFDWDAPQVSWGWMTATEALSAIGMDRPSRADATHCGSVLLELNGRQSKKSNGRKLSKVPPRLSS